MKAGLFTVLMLGIILRPKVAGLRMAVAVTCLVFQVCRAESVFTMVHSAPLESPAIGGHLHPTLPPSSDIEAYEAIVLKFTEIVTVKKPDSVSVASGIDPVDRILIVKRHDGTGTAGVDISPPAQKEFFYCVGFKPIIVELQEPEAGIPFHQTNGSGCSGKSNVEKGP
jgi:hypothetical protein